VAVFDRGAETREQFRSCWREAWGDIPAYDDYGRMLSQAQPDIVCVATRQTMHADQIEEAVAAGVRGILCDKPLATSPAEADRLLNACEQSAVPLAFGLDRRWSDAYRALRSLLAEGAMPRAR
jgi:predicted dehydrogenase